MATNDVRVPGRRFEGSKAGGGASNHQLYIQGLRAIAVLVVVGFHAGLPLPGGFIGVDVFFVISGFVITAMLMRERAKEGRIRLGRFYVRRFKRLTPALALTTSVVAIASVFLMSSIDGTQQTVSKTALGATLLVANFVIASTTGGYFDAPAEVNPLLHTWSLSVEEQFYLVFPALLIGGWALAARLRRPQVVAGLVTVVAAVSFALAVAGSLHVSIPLVPGILSGFYSPATRAWEFAAGALLALGGSRFLVTSPRLANPLAWVGVALLTASLLVISGRTPFPGVWTLVPVAGTLLLLCSGKSEGLVQRVLASRPMVAIGDLSYSIYLWHWPFIVFAKLLVPGSTPALLVAAALSFLPAYASYHWLEQPIRSLPIHRGVPLAKLVAAAIVPPLLLAGGLGVGARYGYANPTIKQYQADILTAHVGESVCTDGLLDAARCTWNADASGQPLYLVGDSNAGQFTEALVASAEETGRPFVALTSDGCEFLSVSFALRDAARTERCRTYTTRGLQFLSTAKPGLVIIANAYLWFRDSQPEPIGVVGGPLSTDPSTKAQTLQTGLTTSIQDLQKAGHRVLVVQTIPQWGDAKEALSWTGCTVFTLHTAKCERTMSLSDALARQARIADAVSGAVSATKASVLDLSKQICPDGVCRTIGPDGRVIYRDGTHISAESSARLAPDFSAAIKAAGAAS